MILTKTASIEMGQYKHFRAISMQWNRIVDRKEVQPVFNQLNEILDNEIEPICVIVDLRGNSFIPLTDTVKATLTGPHRNPNLAAWLVIGENTFAQGIAQMVNHLGDTGKIKWFTNEAELDAYLEEICPYA